jgi:hypothetical protein
VKRSGKEVEREKENKGEVTIKREKFESPLQRGVSLLILAPFNGI